jgi:hypothetical protein
MIIKGESLKMWKKMLVTFFFQGSLIRLEGMGKTKNKLGQDSHWSV